MHTILVMLSSIGLVIGGLVGAFALCWLLWHAFRPIRHPDWAPVVILLLAGLGLSGNLPDSDFLHMVLAFAVAATVPLWLEGRAWRKHRRAAAHGEPGVSA